MADKKIVRAAAAQIAPILNAPGATVEKVLQAIAEAASRGVQFIVFPETLVPYYPYFSFVSPPANQGAEHLRLYDESPTIPGPLTEAMAAAARRHAMVIVLGVNERDTGTLYNAQLVFDADGTMALKRRKITPTYHERMIWGQGDGSGLKVVDTAVGRVGALACWEHFNPLARYTLMAQGEEIHAAQFPGSMIGQIFADQMEVAIRQHALEAGCFVVNATGWLDDEQIAAITPDAKMHKVLRGGNCTAIISPEGKHVVPPMTTGEGLLVADLDMALILKRKRMMDSIGHYARHDLFQLHVDVRSSAALVEHGAGDRSADVVTPFMSPMQPTPSSAPLFPALKKIDSHESDFAHDGTADQRVAVFRGAAG